MGKINLDIFNQLKKKFMSFTGNEGAFISLTDAAALTAEYRSQFKGQTQGHFLGINKLLTLLGQSGAVGIRIYYGIDATTGERQVVLSAVASDESDILASSGALVLDQSVCCPPTCGTSNALNS